MTITLGYSDDQKERIVTLVDRGLPVAEIRRRLEAEGIHVTPKRIEAVVEEHRNPPKKTQSRAERAMAVDKKLVEIKAFAKYQQGMSHAKIAALAGTSVAYVKKWIDNKRATAI